MKQEPDWLKISEVPDFIYQITGVSRTRQSVYRWIKQGKFKPTLRLGVMYTTKQSVVDFLGSFNSS